MLLVHSVKTVTIQLSCDSERNERKFAVMVEMKPRLKDCGGDLSEGWPGIRRRFDSGRLIAAPNSCA